MPQYVLLLHESMQEPGSVAPGEVQRIVDEYSRWAGSLAEQGKLAGAEKLRDDGGRVLRKGGEVSTGPYRGPEDVIGGYFILEAADYDEAIALARDCPHLAYGGEIELREIEPT